LTIIITIVFLYSFISGYCWKRRCC